MGAKKTRHAAHNLGARHNMNWFSARADFLSANVNRGDVCVSDPNTIRMVAKAEATHIAKHIYVH